MWLIQCAWKKYSNWWRLENQRNHGISSLCFPPGWLSGIRSNWRHCCRTRISWLLSAFSHSAWIIMFLFVSKLFVTLQLLFMSWPFGAVLFLCTVCISLGELYPTSFLMFLSADRPYWHVLPHCVRPHGPRPGHRVLSSQWQHHCQWLWGLQCHGKRSLYFNSKHDSVQQSMT